MAGFVWNFGGFWGAVLGSTLWIFLSGVLVYEEKPRTSAILFSLFVMAWGGATVIWRRRGSMAPLKGYLILLGIGFLAALGSLIALEGTDVLADQPGAGSISPYVYLGMFPLLAAVFVLKERSASAK